MRAASAACSTPQFIGRAPRGISARIMSHDPLFEAQRWTANLRILEIDKSRPCPMYRCLIPLVERLIGTMRREFLGHVLFWNSRDLVTEARRLL